MDRSSSRPAARGRLLIPLLEAGLEVDGFDASRAMLDLCRQACEARDLTPSLRQAGFADFQVAQSYGAIVLPVSSFQLIDRFDEGLAVLARFRDALAPGGRLILDLHFPSEQPGPTHARGWTTADAERISFQETRIAVDRVAQTVTSHHRYERWREGVLVRTELKRFVLRWWGLDEIALALRAVGFDAIETCGNYRAGRPPRSTDAVFTVQARRLR